MKLSKYIKQLQEIEKEYGGDIQVVDWDCWNHKGYTPRQPYIHNDVVVISMETSYP